MKIISSQFTISEIRDQLGRGDLIVNKAYQRSPGIWPPQAKTYFIDTVLEGYPFPKVYFYEVYDQRRKKPSREIVDGQQRLSTLIEFLGGDLRLSNSSRGHAGKVFEDLDEDLQQEFITTPVQVDIILQAERSELLEMFRRINAYTAPLNAPEKRHSKYNGRFKWFITELADRYSPLLEEFGIFTPKQMVRMADTEFLGVTCSPKTGPG